MASRERIPARATRAGRGCAREVGSRCARAGAKYVRALALLAIWCWAAGCGSAATGLPAGAFPFRPPTQYRAWWALTEACSGLQGNFNAVTWYIVPGTDSFSLEGSAVNGAWYSNGNRIVLGNRERSDGTLVRHEMLHALMHSGAHPRSQFLANCSDIVVCIEQCVSDAGGPPDTSDTAPLLGPAVVPSTVVLAPDTESISSDSGWITITLTLTNTTKHRGLVAVPLDSAQPITSAIYYTSPSLPGETEQFYYYLTVAPADSAGSVRRVVFDERVPLVDAASRYRISGLFAESTAPARTLTVTP